jgi:hypothetical protein
VLGTVSLLRGELDKLVELAKSDENEERCVYLLALASRSPGGDPAAAGMADRYLERFGEERPLRAASVAAWHERPDEAFRRLERAVSLGRIQGANLGYLRYSPLLRSLHPDPRWAELLRKMNLPVD